MNNGKLTLFWEDPWLYNKPLCVVAPILYDLCHDKLASVYHVLTVDGRLNFKRWLPPILFENWINILGDVYKFSFDNIDDVVTWKWSKYGFFSTKSMYNHLTSDESGPKFSHIWKAKIPYKIKISCWLAEKNAILTKENLVKRNWVDNPTCCFCEDLESTVHLFFSAQWLESFGGLSVAVLAPQTFLEILFNIIVGSKNGYQEALQLTCCV